MGKPTSQVADVPQVLMMNAWGIWTFSKLFFEKVLPFACTAHKQFSSLLVLPAIPCQKNGSIFAIFCTTAFLSPVLRHGGHVLLVLFPILELLLLDLLCGIRRDFPLYANCQPCWPRIGLWNAAVWWLAIVKIRYPEITFLSQCYHQDARYIRNGGMLNTWRKSWAICKKAKGRR